MIMPSPAQETVLVLDVEGRNFALNMFALCCVQTFVRICRVTRFVLT